MAYRAGKSHSTFHERFYRTLNEYKWQLEDGQLIKLNANEQVAVGSKKPNARRKPHGMELAGNAKQASNVNKAEHASTEMAESPESVNSRAAKVKQESPEPDDLTVGIHKIDRDPIQTPTALKQAAGDRLTNNAAIQLRLLKEEDDDELDW